MAMELGRLIEKVQHMDIRLVAGDKGLSHPVTWLHMVESVQSSDFLDGGQLAFTTGIGFNCPDDLYSLIVALQERNVSGLIVNIGPYIESISQKCIEYCNQRDFPLFEVPWKVHLAEIMRICCFAITKDEQRMLETSAAFKNAIFFPKQEELYVVPLSQRGFRVTWNYSVTVIKIFSESSKPDVRTETISFYLENAIRHQNAKFAIFVNESEILLIYADLDEETLKKNVSQVKEKLKFYLSEKEKYAIGVGRLTKSIRCLYKSYNQAKAIERLQEQNKISADSIFYMELGIYRLLMGIEDREIMADYYNHTLKKIVDYDQVNGTDLCITLKTYLSKDGSVKETADALFVHRNTVNYKLNKIEELLGVEMSSMSVRTELMIGFCIRDIL